MFRDPQRQRPPATTKVKDAHSVFDARSLASQTQHRLFGFVQCRRRFVPPPAAVLQTGAQNQLEKLRGHFVVLFVRAMSFDRNNALALAVGKTIECLVVAAGSELFFLFEPFAQQSSHPEANHWIGEPTFFGKLNQRHQKT